MGDVYVEAGREGGSLQDEEQHEKKNLKTDLGLNLEETTLAIEIPSEE